MRFLTVLIRSSFDSHQERNKTHTKGARLLTPQRERTQFSRELRTHAEIEVPSFKNRKEKKKSLNVLPLKTGVGQYIAMHATLTARDFWK